MTIADIFARIGLKTDEAKAHSFKNAMAGVKTTLFAATAAAGIASAAITKITKDALDAAVSFKQFESETGASAQELQKWQAVAEQTNNSAESVTQAVKAIADNQAKIRLGQGNISGYQLLGIDPQQDPFKILEELREKTRGLSEAQRKNVLSMMGINSSMLQTLELSADQFDAMAQNAFIISPRAIETLNQTKSSIDLAGRAIKWLKAQIAVGLAPQIANTTKKMTEFIKANSEGFIKGFKTAYKYVSAFLGAIMNVAGMIDRLIRSTIGWENAIYALVGVIVMMNSALLLSPLGMITAGIILLIAVLDDINAYSQGKNSMFGKLMENFPELGGAILSIVDRFTELMELIGAFVNGDDAKIDNILDSWGRFGDIIQWIIDKINILKDAISNFLQSEGWTNFTEGVRALFGDKEAKANVQARREERGGLFGTGLFARNNNSNQTTTVNAEINVNGAGDPQQTAQYVNSYLQGQLNAASAQTGRDQ